MRKILKNQKGVTLISLMLVIILMTVLLGIAVANIDIGQDIRNYNFMCADIELLEAKIMTYYNNNGTLPITGEVIVNPELHNQASSRDNENYYKIDVKNLLYNVTLNYGGGLTNDDIYIINEQSHEVYYLKGATYEGILYHTNN